MLRNQNALLNPQSIGFYTSALNVRRILFMLVIFEALTLGVVWYIDYAYNINFLYYYIGIIIVPMLMVIIPIEPTFGIVILVATTGLDILGIITKTTAADSEYRLTYFHLALLIVLISTLLNLILRRKTKIPSINLWPPLIAFTVIYAISLIYTPDFFAGAYQFIRYFVLSLICLIVLVSVDTRFKLSVVVWTMILTPVAISILTMYQFYTQGSIFAPIVIKVATVIGIPMFRSTGTFSSPNKLACFLMLGVVIPFGILFLKKINPYTKLLLILSMIISGIGLAASFSRGGWISTLSAIIVIIYFHRKWSYLWYFLGFTVFGIVVVSIQFPEVWEVVFDRFGSIFNPTVDASSSARISLMKSSIWMWQDNPILGVGLRGFPVHYYDYIDPGMPHVLADVKEAHTIQTEILAEQGLVGFIIAVWLFLTVFAHGFSTVKTIKNFYLKNIQIINMGLFIGFISNFTFSSDLTNNSFWIIIGLIYSVPLIEDFVSSGDTQTVKTV